LLYWVDPSARAAGYGLDVFEFALGFFVAVGGVLVFALAKLDTREAGPHRRRIELRPLSAVVVTHLSIIFNQLADALTYMVAPPSLPCFFITFLPMLVPAMLALPLALRQIAFYRSAEISKMATSDKAREIAATHQAKRASDLSSTSSDAQPRKHAPLDAYAVVGAVFDFRGMRRAGNELDVDKVRAWRLVSSNVGTTLLILAALAPFLTVSVVMTATNPMLDAGCPYGCAFSIVRRHEC